MFLGIIQQTVTDSSSAVIHKNSVKFLELDPWGIGMAVIGYLVVFAALLFLYLIFANLTKALVVV